MGQEEEEDEDAEAGREMERRREWWCCERREGSGLSLISTPELRNTVISAHFANKMLKICLDLSLLFVP